MKKLLIILASLSIYGCSFFAQTFTPKKRTIIKDIKIAHNANQYFWNQFHKNHIDSIPTVLERLSEAYFTNPNDVVVTAHLGFTHVWAYASRSKNSSTAQLLSHFELAKKFFGEAYNMNPNDPRLLGFLASIKLMMGSIGRDDRMSADGYFEGKKSIRQWAQFNKFTIGVATTGLSKDNKYFQQGLNWQWETLKDCGCDKVDKNNVDLSSYIQPIFNHTNPKIKRACANTWIAPHNWEGFFLNFGDMLVKNGEWQKGIRMYESVKLSPNFKDWQFKDFLETRIKEAEANVEAFQKNKKSLTGGACKYCHLKSEKEISEQGTEMPDKSIYFLGTGKLYPSF